jgi:hypothetical protein
MNPDFTRCRSPHDFLLMAAGFVLCLALLFFRFNFFTLQVEFGFFG